MRSGEYSTTIEVPESSAVAKGKAPLMAAVVQQEQAGWKRGVSIMDFILRLGAIVAALAAASVMGTSDETLPFFTQFFQFQASYDDLPTFQYAFFHLFLSLFLYSYSWFDSLHISRTLRWLKWSVDRIKVTNVLRHSKHAGFSSLQWQ